MPLQDIFWASLMFAGFALGIWLLFVVLGDLFERADMSAGARIGWTVAVCLLPVIGSLTYLVTRSASESAGELRMGSAPRHRNASIYR